MKKTFIEKLNKKLKDKYEYLKLKDIVVNVREKQIELVLIFPEYIEDIGDVDKKAIENAAKKLIDTTMPISAKFIKSHFDRDIFLGEFLEFLIGFPSLAAVISKDDIIIDEAKKSITVLVAPTIFRFCIERDIVRDVDKFLNRHYCDILTFTFRQKDNDFSEKELQDREARLKLEHAGDRTISVKNVDNLVGKPIYNKAMYIEDATAEREEAVICGTVSDIAVIEYKDKKTGDSKKFYKIALFDPTGKIEFLYFPNKYTAGKVDLLKLDKEIIVRGKLEADKKREGGLVFMARDISYCTIDKNFVANRFVREIDSQYRTISPVKYEEKNQSSFFEVQQSIPQSMLGKTYIVFDLETTGLNPAFEKIIEIGAIKIVNGVITESFCSLINPERPIPIGASAVNGIYDSDVAGKPTIELVLPDFYKFAFDSILVAHNISFDLSFIQAAGKPMGIFFEHETADTLQLARKTFPGFAKYKLEFLTKHFGIKHENAHRAVDDALATAKLFIRIKQEEER